MCLADGLIPAAAERIPELAQVEMNNKNFIPTVTDCGCLLDKKQGGGGGGVLVGLGFKT